jgi:hypothetical protein
MKNHLILAAIAFLVATIWWLKPESGEQPLLQPLIPISPSSEGEMREFVLPQSPNPTLSPSVEGIKRLSLKILSEIEVYEGAVESFFLEKGTVLQLPSGINSLSIRALIDNGNIAPKSDIEPYIHCLDRWWMASLFLEHSGDLEISERMERVTDILKGSKDSRPTGEEWDKIFAPIRSRKRQIEEEVSIILFR